MIEFKTDNRPLFDFSLTQFERAGYALSEVTYDLHKEYSDIIMTDYEARFVAEGVKIHRCVATKVELPTELGEPPLLSLLDYLPDEPGPHPLRYGQRAVGKSRPGEAQRSTAGTAGGAVGGRQRR